MVLKSFRLYMDWTLENLLEPKTTSRREEIGQCIDIANLRLSTRLPRSGFTLKSTSTSFSFAISTTKSLLKFSSK